jgi:hypothetical protein
LRDNEIVVPILRINAPSLENTVARQLLFTFRELARNDRCSIVRITDPFLSKYTSDAVREDGYISQAQNWVAFSISCCGSASTIDVIAKKAADKTGLRVETLHSGLSAAVAADLERTLYYRSPKPRTERAPARLVWYVTRSGAGGIAAVIGCSRLEEIVTDGPAALSQIFRHLGVWQQEQIDQVASDGQALALRFADTEIFPNAVSLPRLRRFADKYGPTLSLRSPQRISAELFSAIYQEGYSKR